MRFKKKKKPYCLLTFACNFKNYLQKEKKGGGGKFDPGKQKWRITIGT